MKESEIKKFVFSELNKRGRQFDLIFQVDKKTKMDLEWLQIFVSSNANSANSPAERQIIADVEEDVTKSAKQEILLVPVPTIADTG